MTVDTLTPREREVLLLLAEGHGLREIADRLSLSWWTVKTHKDNARHKLGAVTQTQAVAMVVRSHT